MGGWLEVSCKAQAAVDAKANGNSLDEVNENIRCDTPGFKQALAHVKILLSKAKDSADSQIPDIAAKLGMDPAKFEKALHRQKEFSSKKFGTAQFELKVKANVSFGLSAEARLGWCDTQGYHMVGVGGHAA